MPYHSIVCVKQVPDTANVTAEAMKADGTVNRAALPTIFNPEDLHALEMALEVRDQYGGTVTVVSMGPPKAADVLRDSLFRGTDRAILLTDRRAAASDTLATSYILAQAIRPGAAATWCSAAARPSTATRPRSARSAPRSWESPDHLPGTHLVAFADGVVRSFAATWATAGKSSRPACPCWPPCWNRPISRGRRRPSGPSGFKGDAADSAEVKTAMPEH